jgi:hypothetical protein
VKADLKKPLEYAAVLGLLLLYRIFAWVRSNVAVVSKLRAPEVNG